MRRLRPARAVSIFATGCSGSGQRRSRAVRVDAGAGRGYARLLVLAVSPAARGHGFGRQLVRDLEAWSAAKGAREMFVNSGLHRASAHAFYERCGYLKSGYRFGKELEIDG